jgi:hypothetical protein
MEYMKDIYAQYKISQGRTQSRSSKKGSKKG